MKFLLPASVFVAVFFVHFLMHEFPSLAARLQYMPDIVIAFVGAIVIARMVAMRRIGLVPLRYWLVFLGFCYVAVSGTLLNDVSPEVSLAGVRSYFKYVPLFLLPFAFDYQERDIARVLVLLLIVGFVQIPIAVYQRFFEYWFLGTGDVITGTLGTSPALSLFCSANVILIVAFYLAGRFSARSTLALCLLLILPATINETKVTPIFLGIGIGALIYVCRTQISIRRFAIVAAVGCVLLGIFVVTYDAMYAGNRGGYVEFMTSPKDMLDSYTLKGIRAEGDVLKGKHAELVADAVNLTSDMDRHLGKLDSIRMPFDSLYPDEVSRLLFGLGIGNVNSTFRGGGDYQFVADRLGGTQTGATILIWETGIFGAAFFLGFTLLVASDSAKLSKESYRWRPLAWGGFAVSLVWIFSLIYTNLFGQQDVLSVFIFMSGVVVALRRGARRGHVVADSPMNGRNRWMAGRAFEGTPIENLRFDA